MSLDKSNINKVVVFVFRRRNVEAEVYAYENMWRRIKTYKASNTINKDNKEKVIEALKQDQQKLIEPQYFDIEIDGIKLLQ
jgi:cytochrome c556